MGVVPPRSRGVFRFVRVLYRGQFAVSCHVRPVYLLLPVDGHPRDHDGSHRVFPVRHHLRFVPGALAATDHERRLYRHAVRRWAGILGLRARQRRQAEHAPDRGSHRKIPQGIRYPYHERHGHGPATHHHRCHRSGHLGQRHVHVGERFPSKRAVGHEQELDPEPVGRVPGAVRLERRPVAGAQDHL